jgi:hypothetical protein
MKTLSIPSELTLSVHKYRVMQGETIIGQFSNAELARETARDCRGSVVLDASVEPPVMVYQGGSWIGEMGRSNKSVVRREQLARSPRGSKAAGSMKPPNARAQRRREPPAGNRERQLQAEMVSRQLPCHRNNGPQRGLLSFAPLRVRFTA